MRKVLVVEHGLILCPRDRRYVKWQEVCTKCIYYRGYRTSPLDRPRVLCTYGGQARAKETVVLSLLGLLSSGLAILAHPVFIWGCICSLGGILILNMPERGF